MKYTIMYQCETCGQVYETEADATNCEKAHIKPTKITECKYDPCQRFPDIITVESEDGKTADYALMQFHS